MAYLATLHDREIKELHLLRSCTSSDICLFCVVVCGSVCTLVCCQCVVCCQYDLVIQHLHVVVVAEYDQLVSHLSFSVLLLCNITKPLPLIVIQKGPHPTLTACRNENQQEYNVSTTKVIVRYKTVLLRKMLNITTGSNFVTCSSAL